MPARVFGRLALVFIAALGLIAVSACHSQPEPETTIKEPSAPGAVVRESVAAEPLKDEIPPDQLAEVMVKHFKGLGCMEQYKYSDAIQAFRDVHTRAPGWIPGAINLAVRAVK